MSGAGILEREFSRYGLVLSPIIQERLIIYIQELEHWNQAINLTSLQGAELIRRLVVEPVWIGEKLQMSGRVADIGSGNGSPGVPLYIARKLTAIHLVEARSRRAAFLRHIAVKLGTNGIFVHKIRAEDLTEPLGPMDWITLQAVNPTAALLASLRRIFLGTTHVVWITAGSRAPTPTATRICVPESKTEAWIFELDQF